MNISACNIKSKNYDAAVLAAEEVLKLEPKNLKALYRRARATALPINAGVPELRKALKDLDLIISSTAQGGRIGHVKREKQRVQELIDVNYARERETYAKMFNPKSSVSEFVKIAAKKNKVPLHYKTSEEKEFDLMMEEIDKEVDAMVSEKIHEFSFEIKPDWRLAHFPEVDDVNCVVEKTIESYQILKKAGKFDDADMMRDKIRETKYAKEHLKLVMSLDFDKPTAKMIDLAKKNNVDVKSPTIINEFKKMQQQNLRDIHLMKEGKKPPSEEEL